ncbi:hypothetical protein SAMN04487783_0714 [Agrococcus baldri]|uniref:Uncharacterized protein n=1 Tax=Agrococcus baldri TaxID=153730 RepID=A0AA94HL97_9MICO|nr:hypothetical protein SAMN04487783_0714 [Agrococcus baldri]
MSGIETAAASDPPEQDPPVRVDPTAPGAPSAPEAPVGPPPEAPEWPADPTQPPGG